MKNLLKSEIRKLLSTRMTWTLVGVSLFISILYVSLYALLAGFDDGTGQTTMPPLTVEASVRMVYAAIGSGYITVLILGIVAFTSEHRHRTMTTTYLATPHRYQVMVAKFLTTGIFSILVGVLTVAIVMPLSIMLVNSKEHFEIPSDDFKVIAFGVIAAYTLYGILGVGLGALIKNQVAAIVGAMVWVMLIERIFTFLLPDIGKWMPAGAADAMLQARSLNGSAFLEPVQGGVLLFGYAVLVAVLASLTTTRQDVS